LAQEFVIKSQNLEDKINQLLPSQGGFQAGVDLSASTMVMPIVDLTEAAEGSQQRADLQIALSLNDVTSFAVSTNTTTTIVNTTGYFRIFGCITMENRSSSDNVASFQLTDGTTTKTIYEMRLAPDATKQSISSNFDFNVFIAAGDSLQIDNAHTTSHVIGCTKQIADINANLTSPS